MGTPHGEFMYGTAVPVSFDATAGEDLAADIKKVETRASVKAMTESGVLKASPGALYGYVVNSTSSGTVKLWDNASAGSGTVLFETATPAAGIYTFPAAAVFANGCYVTIANTLSITFFYR